MSGQSDSGSDYDFDYDEDFVEAGLLRESKTATGPPDAGSSPLAHDYDTLLTPPLSLADETRTDPISQDLPYQYEGLNEPRHIRLLTFRPLKDVDEDRSIRCVLTAVSLDQLPKYVALSYAWGETYADGRHLTHNIIIDSSILRVTSSLHAALVRLRESYGVETGGSTTRPATAFWADAICINQSSSTERREQVLLMSEIYTKADSLAIWLGDLLPGPALQQLLHTDRRSTWYAAHEKVHRALENPWFQRRWIVQEYLLSKANRRFVQVGRETLPWSSFSAITRRWAEGNSAEPQHALRAGTGPLQHPSLAVIQSLDASSVVGGFESSLLQNLHRYDAAKCADERDRVYALRSLSTDAQLLPVSYDWSARELYVTVAQLCATFHLEALLLSSLLRRDSYYPLMRSHLLPTWVSDWSHTISKEAYNSPQHKDAVLHTIAKASTGNVSATSGTYDPDDDSLAVEGWLLTPCILSAANADNCSICRVRGELWQPTPRDDEDPSAYQLRCNVQYLSYPPPKRHHDQSTSGKSKCLFVFEGSRFAFLLQRSDRKPAQPNQTRQYFSITRSYHFRNYKLSERQSSIWRDGRTFADWLGEDNKQTFYLI